MRTAGSWVAACIAATALCTAPARGLAAGAAWYVTFHGGNGGGAINDVIAFDGGGSSLGGILQSGAPGEPALRELRDLTTGPDGNLWVVNGFKGASQVLRFASQPGAGGKLPYLGVFVAFDPVANPGLDHPFDLAFDADGNLYVSSQDTMLVTRYFGPAATAGVPGAPMPLPSGIRPAKPATPYPPGTFVPSIAYTGAAEGVLESVRGIAFGDDGSLYVADESAGQVYAYDGATGAFSSGILRTSSARLGTLAAPGRLARSRSAASSGGPIHLLVEPDGSHLLIGTSSNSSVLRYHFSSGKIETLVSAGSGGLSGPAGMAFATDGDLLVASRKNRRILRYGSSGKPKRNAFVKHLTDDPEFILPVGGRGN